MATPAADLRVGLDANVLIAGCLWPRWPFEVLEAARRGMFRVVLFRPTLTESRQHLDEAGTHRLDAFLSDVQIEWLAEPAAELVESSRGLVRDESDVPLAVALVQAKVDVLVTNDRDFTELEPASAFRSNVAVMLPAVFLRDVCGWSSAELEAVRHRAWDALPG